MSDVVITIVGDVENKEIELNVENGNDFGFVLSMLSGAMINLVDEWLNDIPLELKENIVGNILEILREEILNEQR